MEKGKNIQEKYLGVKIKTKLFSKTGTAGKLTGKNSN
jgi:hypothetical protein